MRWLLMPSRGSRWLGASPMTSAAASSRPTARSPTCTSSAHEKGPGVLGVRPLLATRLCSSMTGSWRRIGPTASHEVGLVRVAHVPVMRVWPRFSLGEVLGWL
jgi:hypothetical protein